jgi:hypothetical protein
MEGKGFGALRHCRSGHYATNAGEHHTFAIQEPRTPMDDNTEPEPSPGASSTSTTASSGSRKPSWRSTPESATPELTWSHLP